MILKLTANAKVNLHLDIGPRRANGYHSLDTIFQEISLSDTLTISAAPEISLRIAGATLSAGPDNLIVRALTMLREELGVKGGANVRLTKRIPMGAGLGGGSADAAAALWGGWMLWKKAKRTKRVPPVLFTCAKKLGADVSFFLVGGTARGTGIGEKLRPLKKTPKRWMVLIYPDVHVNTKVAYGLLDKARNSSSWNVSIQDPSVDPGLRHARMTRFFNSFEPVILKKFPAIARAKQALVDRGCTGVMMSGSGSTVFGFVKSQSAGKKTLRSLGRRFGRTFLAHTV